MFSLCVGPLTRMFTKTGTHYAPHSPASQRPDIPSPLYPDRPIRPLPKHRLRSRLSPDVADSILYPPAPAPAPAPAPSERSPLFHFPNNNVRGERVDGVRESLDKSERDDSNRTLHQPRHTSEIDLDSEEEEIGARARRLYHGHRGYSTFNGLPTTPGLNLSNNPLDSRGDLSGIKACKASTNSDRSSVDGYDSFENTKNKKKRKIPTPGNTGNHHTHLSADLANLGISSAQGTEGSSPEELSGGTGQYYGSGHSASSGSGSSGAGRGRLTRSQLKNGSTRSPLGVSTDGSNAWGGGRTGKLRSRDLNLSGGAKGALSDIAVDTVGRDSSRPETTTQKNFDRGIISAAIANAVGEGLKLPGKDQANISLFQQQPARKPIPAIPQFQPSTAAKAQIQKPPPIKPQFTFTSTSDVAWPGASGLHSGKGPSLGAVPTATSLNPQAPPSFQPQMPRNMATQGTQTGLNTNVNRRPAQAPPAQGLAASQHAPSSVRQSAQQQPTQPATGNQTVPPLTAQQQQQQDQSKKTHRRTGKEYIMAAQQRRLRQEYQNYHHPPSSDDIWICEFCEYESVFGGPPEALIRQYEIKDRKERRRLAEKRRLLEKAKMKGRKGKKGGKGTTKGSAGSGTPNAQQQPTQHQPQNQHHAHDHSQVQSQGTQSEEYLPDEFFDEEEATIPLPDVQVPATTAATGHSLPPMAQQAKRGVLSQQPNATKLGAATAGGDMIKAK
ncbi:MAG: hypothetical protein M1816_008004 [Peltula sp. TS41687]|nr:MAG: hypothetical protein M1816_008004 [Peltula sp. TS41687]